jgi:hypothetical protein
MNDAIQSLWIGSRLSAMEQISIRSFLKNGHDYHLYVYNHVDGIPYGTVLKDAGNILPASQIFQPQGRSSYAVFADLFRYKLLLERGGWWADTDVVCLRPFVFDSDHVFASERDAQGRWFVNNGIIKAPKKSMIMESAWQTCQSKIARDLKWGETGPILMHSLVAKLKLYEYVQAPEIFCPIAPDKWLDTILPGRTISSNRDSVSAHLWNELWRRMGLDKDATYAPSSLYEQWKRQYLL